jgi:tRNA uridine 5-carboxymethylaminomethyl modification enzyme
MGSRTLLVTISLDAVALLPCNTSFGGPGRGQLVREIDALGGEMARMVDAHTIHSRWSNTGKGPAVQAPFALVDRRRYQLGMTYLLEHTDRLYVRQAHIESITKEADRIVVKSLFGEEFEGKTAIITTGTFLGGQVAYGDVREEAGRYSELSAAELSTSLSALGFSKGRFKTGTSPRVSAESVALDELEEQLPDVEPEPFSFWTDDYSPASLPCYRTHTGEKTRRVLASRIKESPLYSGAIQAGGARYCPSIEDKFARFPEREQHPIFLQPDSMDRAELYVQGLSTSLSLEAQEELVSSIAGLENARIMRPGYAVAYDFIYPDQLYPTLETKAVPGLYAAGQINGTSGYEEAAAQGLMAGINAALKVQGREPFVLDRSQAYIGVLIDDLVTKGVDEPYRMFTSRAEYRLLLRSDNADIRLSGLAFDLGLIDGERHRLTQEKERLVAEVAGSLESTIIQPTDTLNDMLTGAGTSPVNRSISAAELLRRPQITVADIEWLAPQLKKLTEEECLLLEVDVKYEGYIKRQLSQVKQFKRLEARHIPEELDYTRLYGLSIQAREKLTLVRPRSLGQASRVSGVSPADINALLVHLEQSKARNSV